MNTEDKAFAADNTAKTGYLAELRRRLAALPAEEREAALTYYEEYFDDAGPDDAERVLRELGPAKTLAEQILSGYSRDYLDSVPRSSSTQVPATPEDAAASREKEAREREEHMRAERERLTRERQEAAKEAPPQKRSGASPLLVIILVILALPLLIPLVATVLAVGIGLLATVLGMAVAIGATVFAILLVGILLLAAGISLFLVHTATALLSCGVGLALLGVGTLLALLCGFICVKLAPALIRLIVRVLRWPFERRVVRA